MTSIKDVIFLFQSVLFLLSGVTISAQDIPTRNYPKNYFRNPLNVPISLSGNFGELRPNHYHMGVDMKTQQKENLPVYAAAEGYVAKIKVEPGGFGMAIYINHPNGFTTLYAHLNSFYPRLEAYVKQRQYEQESWEVYLEDISPELFPLNKGDFIAYSGNTGGSQGPHLHFEIRRTADDVNLNPLLFGLPLADFTKPVLLRLAMYNRNKSTYEQVPKILPLTKTSDKYITVPASIKSASSRISFALSGYDTHSGSTNSNGIYEAWLYDNDQLITGFQMDEISYEDTRYLNAHIDYKTRINGGPYIQHLSQLPGYVNSIYSNIKGDGVLDISDGAVHNIRIVVRDTNGNTSTLTCSVQYSGVEATTPPAPGKMFYPGMVDVYESEDCEFFVNEKCLYDSARIRYNRIFSTSLTVYSPVHAIGAVYIPLQDSLVVRLKPTPALLFNKDRIVMQRSGTSEKEVRKVEWYNEWATARFREFGNFQLLLDEEPPLIAAIGIADGIDLSKSSRIAFTVTDNMGRIKSFRAELDGKWLRFTNDKRRTHIYRFDEMCPPGDHELKVTAQDMAGNQAVKIYRFRR